MVPNKCHVKEIPSKIIGFRVHRYDPILYFARRSKRNTNFSGWRYDLKSFEIDFLNEASSEINVFRVLEISFGSFSDRRSKPNANFSGRQHCFGVC